MTIFEDIRVKLVVKILDDIRIKRRSLQSVLNQLSKFSEYLEWAVKLLKEFRITEKNYKAFKDPL